MALIKFETNIKGLTLGASLHNIPAQEKTRCQLYKQTEDNPGKYLPTEFYIMVHAVEHAVGKIYVTMVGSFPEAKSRPFKEYKYGNPLYVDKHWVPVLPAAERIAFRV